VKIGGKPEQKVAQKKKSPMSMSDREKGQRRRGLTLVRKDEGPAGDCALAIGRGKEERRDTNPGDREGPIPPTTETEKTAPGKKAVQARRGHSLVVNKGLGECKGEKGDHGGDTFGQKKLKRGG